MKHDAPYPPRPLSHLRDLEQRVLSGAQLRQHGIGAAEAAARCRRGGPWQLLLPGVYLLHPGPPTEGERLRAALLYAARTSPRASGAPRVPAQTPGGFREVLLTGLAALPLYGLGAAVPPGPARVDVLVPSTRRLRGTGFVRLVRASRLPVPRLVGRLPVAPLPRVLADSVCCLGDTAAARALLTAAVRGGRCEAGALVAEAAEAGLPALPGVAAALDALLAEGRARAEDLLYRAVRGHGLPEPLWNVVLRLPGGGPGLGGVDAYWPAQAVAVELDTRTSAGRGDAGRWARAAGKRDRLERLGITLVRLTPRGLREHRDRQALRIAAALRRAQDRRPPAYVVVLPR